MQSYICSLHLCASAFNTLFCLQTEISGTSKVTVLQPTAELGYFFLLDNGLVLLPTIALGAEINIQTEGEEVGQGAILLLGATIAKRF